MKFLPILTIVFISWLNLWEVHSIPRLPKSIDEVYWRDFRGLVPSDAISGGTDENGLTTYLGQFTVKCNSACNGIDFDLLPATIQRGNEVAHAPYRRQTVYSNSTSNVKVLCSNYVSRYKWYAPNAVFPPNCRFVIGGYEAASAMYIGRATVGKQIITGKIFADSANHYPGLIIPYQGGESLPESFEVLTYCY